MSLQWNLRRAGSADAQERVGEEREGARDIFPLHRGGAVHQWTLGCHHNAWHTTRDKEHLQST